MIVGWSKRKPFTMIHFIYYLYKSILLGFKKPRYSADLLGLPVLSSKATIYVPLAAFFT